MKNIAQPSKHQHTCVYTVMIPSPNAPSCPAACRCWLAQLPKVSRCGVTQAGGLASHCCCCCCCNRCCKHLAHRPVLLPGRALAAFSPPFLLSRLPYLLDCHHARGSSTWQPGSCCTCCCCLQPGCHLRALRKLCRLGCCSHQGAHSWSAPAPRKTAAPESVTRLHLLLCSFQSGPRVLCC